MLILDLLLQDELNTSNVIGKAIFHLYTSTHIRLILQRIPFAIKTIKIGNQDCPD